MLSQTSYCTLAYYPGGAQWSGAFPWCAKQLPAQFHLQVCKRMKQAEHREVAPLTVHDCVRVRLTLLRIQDSLPAVCFFC